MRYYPAFLAIRGNKRYKSKSVFHPAPSNVRTSAYNKVLLTQCNRRYPCNHCTHRRRPEKCAYYQAVQAASLPLQTDQNQGVTMLRSDSQLGHEISHDLSTESPDPKEMRSPKNNSGPSSLAESFGYFEDSNTNTVALLRRVSAL